MLTHNYDLSINPLNLGYASAGIIYKLDKDEIFVFGSNLKGEHISGAALLAAKKFGAENGIGEGLTGQTYAIPTKDSNLKVLFLKDIKKHVDEFITYAGYNPTIQFLVTKIGCGLAGYSIKDIAPLFANSVYFKNIHLPKEFIEYLQTSYYSLK